MKLPQPSGLGSLIKNFALISLVESQQIKKSSNKPPRKPEIYNKEKFKRDFKKGRHSSNDSNDKGV
jgi:hypothetical protein